MERLKTKSQFMKADRRNLHFVITTRDAYAKKLSLDDIYKAVKRISLHSGVPEDIRSHFSQAQNLAVYSWFHYPFNVTAQFMAFVSLEYALKLKTGKEAGLKNLIKEAVNKGWVTDDGFAIAKHRSSQSKERYVNVLIESIPNLRNRLAHGTNMLHNNALSSLRICADFINQLFPKNRRLQVKQK